MSDLENVDWTLMPRPRDDGAADHLVGMDFPSTRLSATIGGTVDVSALDGTTVVYVYPMTGKPGEALPTGWDSIPGARGCTPQTCAFRDHAADLKKAGVDYLFGLSTQTLEEQKEASQRLHLPFALLSDADLTVTKALRLPSFECDGKIRAKRLTLVIINGRIKHCFYPVFPPDEAPRMLQEWLLQKDPPGVKK